jgi:hypothetical protein
MGVPKLALIFSKLRCKGHDVVKSSECNFIIYTPKSAQKSLHSMIQLKYDNDRDPVNILTYGFAFPLHFIYSKHMFYFNDPVNILTYGFAVALYLL